MEIMKDCPSSMNREKLLQDLAEALAEVEAACVDTFPSIQDYIGSNTTDVVGAFCHCLRDLAKRGREMHKERTELMIAGRMEEMRAALDKTRRRKSK